METLALHPGFHGNHYSALRCYFKACGGTPRFQRCSNIGRNFSHTPHGPTQAPPQITMAQHTCVALKVGWMISYPSWAQVAMLHDCTKMNSFYPTRLHIFYHCILANGMQKHYW